MSKYLKGLFLVHAIVGVIVGLPLLLAPGRAADFLQWAPVDPLVTRMFGAALLALAVGSARGFLAREKAQVKTILEMDIVFCALSAAGLARHLFKASYPAIVWVIFGTFLVFGLAWIVAYFKE
jgi:threonine/homoserine/homoserine lactone efflux protein